MKNNLKLLLFSVFLLIFLLCVNSCGGKNSPVQETANSDRETVTDTEQDLYLDNSTGIPAPVVPPMKEYAAFRNFSFVFAEFGEPILPANLSDGTNPLLFEAIKSPDIAKQCFAYPIKILRKFEATAYSKDEDCKSFFPAMLQEWEAQGDYRPQSLFNYAVDYRNKNEIMAEYDDIILIDADTNVAIGEQYCLSVYYMPLKYPDDLSEEFRFPLTPMYDLVTMKPILIPVKDDKICLPEEYYQKKSYPKEKEYVYMLAVLAEDANEMLKKLGLTDNLFRDGMTVDELDEYFNLVTNKETFAPLFESVETQEPVN